MLQAFVGIVSQRGIEVFCPEATLNLGMAQEALHIMQHLAREYGLLVPGHEEAAGDRAVCQR